MIVLLLLMDASMRSTCPPHAHGVDHDKVTRS